MIVNPGLRRMVSAIQRLFNSASFYAPLTHSLVLERGTGDPTFTRATEATFDDWEGVLRTVPAGCARFQNGGMVRNLVAASEDITGWSNASGFTISAEEFTTTATGGFIQMPLISGLPTKGVFRWSMLLSCPSGDGTLAVTSIDAGDGSDGVLTSLMITETPTRYSGLADFSGSSTFSGNLTLQVGNQGSATDTVKTISITEIQLEDVTGQADQTAGPYVSVGVLSAPYHGAGADGVAFFDTDRDGNPLSPVPKYLSEGARTNLCAYSQSIAAGFTFSGTCAGADNVGTYAGVPFTRITNATGGAAYRAVSYTGNADKAFAFCMKQDAAVTGTYEVAVYDNTAAQTRGRIRATIASGGAITFAAITGSISSVTELADGVYYVKAVATGVIATNTNLFYANFAIGTATSALVSAMQTEDATFASTYIPTTTVAVTRNADELSYAIPSTLTSFAAKGFSLNQGATSGTNFTLLSAQDASVVANSIVLRVEGSPLKPGTLVFSGSALQSTKTHTAAITADTKHNIAVSVATNNVVSAVDGGDLKTDVSATPPVGITTLYVGHYPSDQWLFGNSGSLYGWQLALSASELQAVTQP